MAAEFFERNLYSPDAQEAQRFLGARGFDPAATRKFGVGYAPRGWDHLLKHLRSQGFTDEELKATGMFSEGNRGLYDASAAASSGRFAPSPVKPSVSVPAASSTTTKAPNT